MISITHDTLHLIILLLILLIGTMKWNFKKTLIIMILFFAIDLLIGSPFQIAIQFHFFKVLGSLLATGFVALFEFLKGLIFGVAYVI